MKCINSSHFLSSSLFTSPLALDGWLLFFPYFSCIFSSWSRLFINTRVLGSDTELGYILPYPLCSPPKSSFTRSNAAAGIPAAARGLSTPTATTAGRLPIAAGIPYPCESYSNFTRAPYERAQSKPLSLHFAHSLDRSSGGIIRKIKRRWPIPYLSLLQKVLTNPTLCSKCSNSRAAILHSNSRYGSNRTTYRQLMILYRLLFDNTAILAATPAGRLPSTAAATGRLSTSTVDTRHSRYDSCVKMQYSACKVLFMDVI